MLQLTSRRYCEMQLQSLPGRQDTLNFDDIVPPTTSAKHVAAEALYHCLGKWCLSARMSLKQARNACLVLATKDLIAVKQTRPFDSITFKIK